MQYVDISIAYDFPSRGKSGSNNLRLVDGKVSSVHDGLIPWMLVVRPLLPLQSNQVTEYSGTIVIVVRWKSQQDGKRGTVRGAATRVLVPRMWHSSIQYTDNVNPVRLWLGTTQGPNRIHKFVSCRRPVSQILLQYLGQTLHAGCIRIATATIAVRRCFFS